MANFFGVFFFYEPTLSLRYRCRKITSSACKQASNERPHVGMSFVHVLVETIVSARSRGEKSFSSKDFMQTKKKIAHPQRNCWGAHRDPPNSKGSTLSSSSSGLGSNP
jgi:hypothetical protein